MIRRWGKKPAQNRACSCIRPEMRQQAGSVGSGRQVQRAQVAAGAGRPLHRPAPAPALPAPPRGRAGPSKARFLGLQPTEGESPRKSASLQTFFAAILALLWFRRFMPVKEFFGCRADRPVQVQVKWSQFSWVLKKVRGGQPVDNQKWRFMFGREVQGRRSRWIGNRDGSLVPRSEGSRPQGLQPPHLQGLEQMFEALDQLVRVLGPQASARWSG